MPITVPAPGGSIVAFTEDETNAILTEYNAFQSLSDISEECQNNFDALSSSLEDIKDELLTNSLAASNLSLLQPLQPDRENYGWTYLNPTTYQRTLTLETAMDRFLETCGGETMAAAESNVIFDTARTGDAAQAEEQVTITEEGEVIVDPWQTRFVEQVPWKWIALCAGCGALGYLFGKSRKG
jgi:hypothetical protein